MKAKNRIVLYPKDIQNITGREAQTARKLHRQILAANHKPTKGFVTVDDFCEYTGTSKEEVMKFLT
jgi:hypothetical protein